MLMELPGGNSKLVISIGMVLPYPVGTQLRIWPSVPYMAAAATSIWKEIQRFFQDTGVLGHLEKAQLFRQQRVSLPQLDISLLKTCSPLYNNISHINTDLALHLKCISKYERNPTGEYSCVKVPNGGRHCPKQRKTKSQTEEHTAWEKSNWGKYERNPTGKCSCSNSWEIVPNGGRHCPKLRKTEKQLYSRNQCTFGSFVLTRC